MPCRGGSRTLAVFPRAAEADHHAVRRTGPCGARDSRYDDDGSRPAADPRAAPVRPPVPPPPRWAVRAAHVAAWSTVPSGVWRVALVLGVPVGVMEREEFLAGFPGNSPLFALAYVLLLGAVAEAASYLTLGLVRPWGR